MATPEHAAPSPAVIDGLGFFNELQSRKNWPHGGPPVVFDVRPSAAYDDSHVRGAFCIEVNALGELDGAPAGCWSGRTVILVGDVDDVGASDGAGATAGPAAARLCGSEVAQHLCADARPPARLLVGDLEDAASLHRLKAHLNVTHAVTALADPPPSLRAAVREAGVRHLWCAVRDVAEADIKNHFDQTHAFMEEAFSSGGAIFIHCSRGVSRSASLVIAHLMRKRSMTVEQALAFCVERRPIVNPNEGFLTCLREFGRELTGERSGVYVPIKATEAVALPPTWAAVGATVERGAKLVVTKGGEELESLEVGEHPMYVFGRSLTCDFQIEHPSASRQHAALVHGQDGGVYLLDLGSSHGSQVDGTLVPPAKPAGPLRPGAIIRFGASARSYTLAGLRASPPSGTSGPAAASASGEYRGGDDARVAQLRAVAGRTEDTERGDDQAGKRGRSKPMDPRKLAKKKRKWIAGPKSSSKMSENERVSRMAGAGSGCMGPGFD